SRLLLGEDGAEKGLLRLEVVWRLAEDRSLRGNRANQCGHGRTVPPKGPKRIDAGSVNSGGIRGCPQGAGYALPSPSSAPPVPSVGAPSSNCAEAARFAASASSSASVAARLTPSPRACFAASSAERATLTGMWGSTSA